jgi:hypothetical protein
METGLISHAAVDAIDSLGLAAGHYSLRGEFQRRCLPPQSAVENKLLASQERGSTSGRQ